MSAASASFLLLLLLLLAPPLSATALSQQQPRRLRDTRKLQPSYWLKAAGKHIPSSAAAAQEEDAACVRDYGQQYVERWRALHGTYCNASATATTSSDVQCYAHPTADLSTCLARNLLLTSSAAFLGGTTTTPHSSELPQPAAGSIQLACSRTVGEPQSFLRGRLSNNEGMRAWLVTAPTFAGPAASAAEQQQMQQSCSGRHAVAHPVLFLLRVDPQNSFHNLEAVVSVFAALAVLQLEAGHMRHGMEVVIADDRQAGYFLHIWRRLAWPHPLRVLRQQPFPDNTCFSRAIIAPYAAHTQSLLTFNHGQGVEVLCESVVLQAVSRWLRYLFRDLLPASQLRSGGGSSDGGSTGSSGGGGPADSLLPGQVLLGGGGGSSLGARELAPLSPSPTQSAVPLELRYVVWLSRRRFEQQRAAELTDWQKQRALSAQQEEELVVALQRAVLQWNAQTCVTMTAAAAAKSCQARRVMFSLQVVELSELSFYPDQLSVMARAGVLVGVHGAGLSNQIYMQPRTGAVVELWYNMEGNTHYHNMAHMLGHAYSNVAAEEGQLDVAAVAAKVTAAMDEAAARHTAAAAGVAAANKGRSWWWHRRQADPKRRRL